MASPIGAPLGITQHITSRGVFPPARDEPSNPSPEQLLTEHFSPWTNYKSAEDAPDTCQEILDKMVSEGWAVEFNDTESRSEVPPAGRNNLEMTLSDLPSNIRKLRMAEPMQLIGMCQISEMHAQPTPIPAIYEVRPTFRGQCGMGRMAR